MHIAFNGVMLLALGTFFEKQMGGRGLLVFLTVCSLVGAAFYMAFEPFSTAPVIGASGGLSGLFAAMIMVFHDQRIYGPISARLVRYGVWPLLGVWLVFMVVMGMAFGEIAWQAHVGGYIAGIVLMLLRKRGLIRL